MSVCYELWLFYTVNYARPGKTSLWIDHSVQVQSQPALESRAIAAFYFFKRWVRWSSRRQRNPSNFLSKLPLQCSVCHLNVWAMIIRPEQTRAYLRRDRPPARPSQEERELAKPKGRRKSTSGTKLVGIDRNPIFYLRPNHYRKRNAVIENRK